MTNTDKKEFKEILHDTFGEVWVYDSKFIHSWWHKRDSFFIFIFLLFVSIVMIFENYATKQHTKNIIKAYENNETIYCPKRVVKSSDNWKIIEDTIFIVGDDIEWIVGCETNKMMQSN